MWCLTADYGNLQRPEWTSARTDKGTLHKSLICDVNTHGYSCCEMMKHPKHEQVLTISSSPSVVLLLLSCSRKHKQQTGELPSAAFTAPLGQALQEQTKFTNSALCDVSIFEQELNQTKGTPKRSHVRKQTSHIISWLNGGWLSSILPAADSRDSKQHADSRHFILAARGLPLTSPAYIYTALAEGQRARRWGWRTATTPMSASVCRCSCPAQSQMLKSRKKLVLGFILFYFINTDALSVAQAELNFSQTFFFPLNEACMLIMFSRNHNSKLQCNWSLWLPTCMCSLSPPGGQYHIMKVNQEATGCHKKVQILFFFIFTKASLPKFL